MPAAHAAAPARLVIGIQGTPSPVFGRPDLDVSGVSGLSTTTVWPASSMSLCSATTSPFAPGFDVGDDALAFVDVFLAVVYLVVDGRFGDVVHGYGAVAAWCQLDREHPVDVDRP